MDSYLFSFGSNPGRKKKKCLGGPFSDPVGEDDYSSVPDAMDLIHLGESPVPHGAQLGDDTEQVEGRGTSSRQALRRNDNFQPELVFLERRHQGETLVPLVPLAPLVPPPLLAPPPLAPPPLAPPVSTPRFGDGIIEVYDKLEAPLPPDLLWSPHSVPPTPPTPSTPCSQSSSPLLSQMDLSSVVESQASSSFFPPVQEKSILAPISKNFTQHWIDIGADLTVLLLDFDAAFTLLIPHIPEEKKGGVVPFKSNTTSVEVQTRLTSKGQKLTFMKFHFLSPETKVVAPVLDDKVLGMKLLRKRNACVFLGRTLDDIKSAPPRRLSPLQPVPSQQALMLPPSVPPTPIQDPSLPHRSNDALASIAFNPQGGEGHPPAWNSTAKPPPSVLQNTPPNPVPLGERVYPKDLTSIYPALKDKELEKILTCRYCNKRFSFLSEHLIHLKSHTHDVDKVVEMSIQVWVSDRKLKCDKCKKKKTYTLDYAKHKDSHEILGLSCHLCEAGIPLPANFGLHMEEFHPEDILGDSKGENVIQSPGRKEMIPLVPNLPTTPTTLGVSSPAGIKPNGPSFTQGFIAKKSLPPPSFMPSKSPSFPAEPLQSNLQIGSCSSRSVSSVPALLGSNPPPPFNNNQEGSPPPKTLLQLPPNPEVPFLQGNHPLKSPPPTTTPFAITSTENQNMGLMNNIFSSPSQKETSSLNCIQSSARELCGPSPAVSSPSLIHTNTSVVETQSLRKQWRSSEEQRAIQSIFDDTEPSSLTKGNNDSDKIGLSLSSVDSGVSDVNSASPSIPHFDRSVPLLNDPKSIRDSLDSKPDEEFLSALDMYGLESRKMHSPITSMSEPSNDLVNRHNILTDEPMMEELPSKVMQLDELCETMDMSMEDVPSSRDRKAWKMGNSMDYGNYDERMALQGVGYQDPESHNSNSNEDVLADKLQGESSPNKSPAKWDVGYPPSGLEDKQGGDNVSPSSEEQIFEAGPASTHQQFNPVQEDSNYSTQSETIQEESRSDNQQGLKASDSFKTPSSKSSAGESDEDSGECAIYRCDKCGNEFVTSTSLTIHKISCVNDDHKCDLCDNRFMSLKSLKMHMSMCKKKSEVAKPEVQEKNLHKMEKPPHGKKKRKNRSLEKISDENKNILKIKLPQRSDDAVIPGDSPKPIERDDHYFGEDLGSEEGVQEYGRPGRRSRSSSHKHEAKVHKRKNKAAGPSADSLELPKPSLKINVGQILRQKELQNRLREKSTKRKQQLESMKKYPAIPVNNTSKAASTRKLSLNKPPESNKEMEYEKPLKVVRPSLKVRFGLSSNTKRGEPDKTVSTGEPPRNKLLPSSAGHQDFQGSRKKIKKDSNQMHSTQKHFGSILRTDSNGHIRLKLTLSSKSKENQKKQEPDPMEYEPEVKKVKPLKLKLNKTPEAPKLLRPPTMSVVHPLKIKLPLPKDTETKRQPEMKIREETNSSNQITSPKIPKLVIKKDLIKSSNDNILSKTPRQVVFIKKCKASKRLVKKKCEPLVHQNSLLQSLRHLSCFVRLENVEAYRYEEEKCNSSDGFVVKLSDNDCDSLNLQSLSRDSPPPPLVVPPLRLKLNAKFNFPQGGAGSDTIASTANITPSSPTMTLQTGRPLSSVLSNLSGSYLPREGSRWPPLLKKKKKIDPQSNLHQLSGKKDYKFLSSALDILISRKDILSDTTTPKEKSPVQEQLPKINPELKSDKKDRPCVAPYKKNSYLGLTGADYRSRKRKKKNRLPPTLDEAGNSSTHPCLEEAEHCPLSIDETENKKVPCLKINRKLLSEQSNSMANDDTTLASSNTAMKMPCVFFAKKSIPKPIEDVPQSPMSFFSYEESHSQSLNEEPLSKDADDLNELNEDPLCPSPDKIPSDQSIEEYTKTTSLLNDNLMDNVSQEDPAESFAISKDVTHSSTEYLHDRGKLSGTEVAPTEDLIIATARNDEPSFCLMEGIAQDDFLLELNLSKSTTFDLTRPGTFSNAVPESESPFSWQTEESIIRPIIDALFISSMHESIDKRLDPSCDDQLESLTDKSIIKPIIDELLTSSIEFAYSKTTVHPSLNNDLPYTISAPSTWKAEEYIIKPIINGLLESSLQHSLVKKKGQSGDDDQSIPFSNVEPKESHLTWSSEEFIVKPIVDGLLESSIFEPTLNITDKLSCLSDVPVSEKESPLTKKVEESIIGSIIDGLLESSTRKSILKAKNNHFFNTDLPDTVSATIFERDPPSRRKAEESIIKPIMDELLESSLRESIVDQHSYSAPLFNTGADKECIDPLKAKESIVCPIMDDILESSIRESLMKAIMKPPYHQPSIATIKKKLSGSVKKQLLNNKHIKTPLGDKLSNYIRSTNTQVPPSSKIPLLKKPIVSRKTAPKQAVQLQVSSLVKKSPSVEHLKLVQSLNIQRKPPTSTINSECTIPVMRKPEIKVMSKGGMKRKTVVLDHLSGESDVNLRAERHLSSSQGPTIPKKPRSSLPTIKRKAPSLNPRINSKKKCIFPELKLQNATSNSRIVKDGGSRVIAPKYKLLLLSSSHHSFIGSTSASPQQQLSLEVCSSGHSIVLTGITLDPSIPSTRWVLGQQELKGDSGFKFDFSMFQEENTSTAASNGALDISSTSWVKYLRRFVSKEWMKIVHRLRKILMDLRYPRERQAIKFDSRNELLRGVKRGHQRRQILRIQKMKKQFTPLCLHSSRPSFVPRITYEMASGKVETVIVEPVLQRPIISHIVKLSEEEKEVPFTSTGSRIVRTLLQGLCSEVMDISEPKALSRNSSSDMIAQDIVQSLLKELTQAVHPSIEEAPSNINNNTLLEESTFPMDKLLLEEEKEGDCRSSTPVLCGEASNNHNTLIGESGRIAQELVEDLLNAALDSSLTMSNKGAPIRGKESRTIVESLLRNIFEDINI